MFWNDRQRLAGLTRIIRTAGWIAGVLVLIVGTFTAETGDGQLGLLLRAVLAGAVLALSYGSAWLVDLYAERAASR